MSTPSKKAPRPRSRYLNSANAFSHCRLLNDASSGSGRTGGVSPVMAHISKYFRVSGHSINALVMPVRFATASGVSSSRRVRRTPACVSGVSDSGESGPSCHARDPGRIFRLLGGLRFRILGGFQRALQRFDIGSAIVRNSDVDGIDKRCWLFSDGML
jgi:hypothetical protein